MLKITLITFALFTNCFPIAHSEEFRRLPDEYEASPGHALGFDNSGSVATGGLASVRLNPAMLTMEQEYTIGGGYHWPSLGREFYQVGVVDTKTSSVGAGFNYSSFSDDYPIPTPEEQLNNSDFHDDSRVKRRATLAFAKALDKIAVGINGQFVEAHSRIKPETEITKGTTFGLGFAGLFTPTIRFGVSAENLANKKVKDYAPRTIRAGIAFLLLDGQASAHIDYQRRDRIAFLEARDQPDILLNQSTAGVELNPEQKMASSLSFKIYDTLRLLGGYGHYLGEPRRSVAGGVAVVSGNIALSYAAQRPDLARETAHHAVNLALKMSF